MSAWGVVTTEYRRWADGKIPWWALVAWALSCLVFCAAPGWALDAGSDELPSLHLSALDYAGGPAVLPLAPEMSVLDPRSGASQAVLQNTGTSVTLNPTAASSLTTGLYYSKRLGYLDATRTRLSLSGSYQAAMPFASGQGGRERTLQRGRALYQKLDLKQGKWSLAGTYQEVDAGFEVLASLRERDPLAGQLAAARGLGMAQFALKYGQAGRSLAADYGSASSQVGTKRYEGSYQRFEGTLGRFSLTGNLSEVDTDFQAAKEQLEANPQLKALWALRGLDVRQFGLTYGGGKTMSLAAEVADVTSLHGGRNDASYRKFEGKFGRLSLAGTLLEVDAGFTAAQDQLKDNAQVKMFNANRGLAQRQFSLAYGAGTRFALSSSYNRVVNNQPGHAENGLTRTETKHELTAKLGKATDLGITYGTLQLASNSTGRVTSDTATSTLRLAHTFNRSLSASLTKELVEETRDSNEVKTDLTALRLEFKPRPGMSLAMDTRDKSYSDGRKEALRLLTFDGGFGQGASRFSLKAEVKDAESGQGGAQKERANKLSLTAGGSPLLGLTVNYETLQQEGPSATRDYRKLAGTLTSQPARLLKLTAGFNRESELGQPSRADRSLKLEWTPRRLTLVASQEYLKLKDKPDAATTGVSLGWKIGRPLLPWAKETSAGGPFGEPYRYGFARMPGWAQIPDAGVQYSLISRHVVGEANTNTQVLGYNRMLGHSLYLRLAMQEHPLDDKGNIVKVKRCIYELGARLGSRVRLVARSLSEQNLENRQQTDTNSLLAQAELGKRFSLTAGYQSSELSTGAGTTMTYGAVNWKFGRPLEKWAAEAGDAAINSVFSDATTYGYRPLPAWRLLPEQGIIYQTALRDNRQGRSDNTTILGYQTMLGRALYLKLTLQRNPLDSNNNVLIADRQLYEVGVRLAGKLTLLGRFTRDVTTQPDTGGDSRMLVLYGALSSKEKLATIFVFDRMRFSSGDYDAKTFGLEYSRELSPDHYLTLKATTTDNDKPGLSSREAHPYRIDLAYKKDI